MTKVEQLDALDTVTKYTFLAWNRQGASFQDTAYDKLQIEECLSEFSDPENLRVEVQDDNGDIVATKNFDSLDIFWVK